MINLISCIRLCWLLLSNYKLFTINLNPHYFNGSIKFFSDFIMLIQNIWYLPDYVKHIYLLLEILIFSFLSSYSFNTLFNTTNSSWLILAHLKPLELKLVRCLVYFLLTKLCYWVFFFFSKWPILFNYLSSQTKFYSTVELVILPGIPTKETKA